MGNSDSEPPLRMVQTTLTSMWRNAVPISEGDACLTAARPATGSNGRSSALVMKAQPDRKEAEQKLPSRSSSTLLTEAQAASQDAKGVEQKLRSRNSSTLLTDAQAASQDAKGVEQKLRSRNSSTLLTDAQAASQDAKGVEQKPNSLSSSRDRKSSASLAEIAKETKALLPDLLERTHAPPDGTLYKDVDPLDPKFCPRFLLEGTKSGELGTRIRVVNADTLDAAIALEAAANNSVKGRVVALNMANARHGGGGWLKGAMAQEEAICYRSSLSFTLKRRYYPLADRSAIYSPNVLVFRSSLAKGHLILPETTTNPDALPRLSFISIAAIRDPPLTNTRPAQYRRRQDRELMKHKMRVVLRIAARQRHRSLVLSALGCGAFHNPPEEVATCWKEVFAEQEFRGGWWETVIFAILSGDRERVGGRKSNFEIFRDELDGCIV